MFANKDVRLLLAIRIVRMFSYGLLALIPPWITTRADRPGRKQMLLIGISALAGAPFVIISGTLKLIPDFRLYRNFKTVKPHEEAGLP